MIIDNTFSLVLDRLREIPSTAEFEIGGCPDPFLQAGLVRLVSRMTLLAPEKHGVMAPVIKTVAESLDNSKNASAAVTFECVRALLSVSSRPPSRPVANVDLLFGGPTEAASPVSSEVEECENSRDAFVLLAELLESEDINARFAALDCLASLVESRPKAVAKMASSILPCLHDEDHSIRMRALRISPACFSHHTVQELTRDFLHLMLSNTTDNPKAEDAQFVTELVAVVGIVSWPHAACEERLPLRA